MSITEILNKFMGDVKSNYLFLPTKIYVPASVFYKILLEQNIKRYISYDDPILKCERMTFSSIVGDIEIVKDTTSEKELIKAKLRDIKKMVDKHYSPEFEKELLDIIKERTF